MIESKEAEINQLMATSNDAEQLMALQKELDQITHEQEMLMEEWELLSEELE